MSTTQIRERPLTSIDRDTEWLEADGLGGFASGTTSGIRTRRYHALLLAARRPPTDRVVLVSGFEAWLETPSGRLQLSSQLYAPDVVHPDGASRIVEFVRDPWPRWIFRIGVGVELEQELVVRHGAPIVALSWRVRGGLAGGSVLAVRPLLAGRDFHGLMRENQSLRLDPGCSRDRVVFRVYPELPPILCAFSGDYQHEPCWYRNFLYERELERGLDCVEDLASPGVFRWRLVAGEAWLVLAADTEPARAVLSAKSASELGSEIHTLERRRREAFKHPLERAADAYLVARGGGKTLIAGYPWFSDWGRDTFIALRGLCLATGRYAEASQILLEWANHVSLGMLPNRFPDGDAAAEYNSVDAALWYVIVTGEFLKSAGSLVDSAAQSRLLEAIDAILSGYRKGTRFRIGMDSDGLLAAGELGVQLTWMDAKIGDHVITPRIGKPVEIQALWINALKVAQDFSGKWQAELDRARDAFERRFWSDELGYLHDVVDVDHLPGKVDGSLRPNQLFATGGLSLCLVSEERARKVVDRVEQQLLTPLGLRSLAPHDPHYAGRYIGGLAARDESYHQGTVWPWLIGAFVEAWIRVRGATSEVKAEARSRFLAPLDAHLEHAGLGHVSEIADGDPPHTPRGCPFQAWSLAELLRLERQVLSE